MHDFSYSLLAMWKWIHYCLEMFALFFFCFARLSSLTLLLFVFLLSLSEIVFTLTQSNKHKLFSGTVPLLETAAFYHQCCCVCVWVRARVCVHVCVRTVDRWRRTAGLEWQVCVTRASTVVKERKTTLRERNYLKRNISASLWLPRAGKQRGLGGGIWWWWGGVLS